MIKHVQVWIQLNGQQTMAGEMVCETSSNGECRGAFRYAKEYLSAQGSFALDPISLPLKEDEFSVPHPGVFSVFEDSLPDDWGRRLLIRKHQIAPRDQHIVNLLLALAANGLGALSYSPSKPLQNDASTVSSLHLSKLLQQAEQFEHGETVNNDISLLLSAGSSPGGARPKALVFDESDGIHYLAKFPSVKDQVDVVRIEAATMKLAQLAGLNVPPCRLVKCGDKSVLLVRRFDRTQNEQHHMISMQSLLNMRGYYVCRYVDMVNVLRKVSSDPQHDIELIFRQMVFNAVINNTDDHLKNFWMLHDQKQGWELSPAFDLIPNIGQNSEHVLFFDIDPIYPGRGQLVKIGKSWGITKRCDIVDEVFCVVAKWRDVFLQMGVLESDCAKFSEIDSYLVKD